MKMEQSVTSLENPSTNDPIIINMLLASDKVVSLSSLSSIESKRVKQPTNKTMNYRTQLLSKLSLLKLKKNTQREDIGKLQQSYSCSSIENIPSIFSHPETQGIFTPKVSVGELKLNEIIKELKEKSAEGESFKEHYIPVTGYWRWIRRSRLFLVGIMGQPKFHYAIIILIIIDLVLVFVDLVLAQLSLPCLSDQEMQQYNATQQREGCLLSPSSPLETAESILYFFSLVLISIFVLEISAALYAFGWRRYTKVLYLVDAIIVLLSFVLEVFFHFNNFGRVGRAAAGIAILRLWKIIRAIHAIAHSISIRNHMIIEKIIKAREILKEEKLQADKIIDEQQITIEDQQIDIDEFKKRLEKTAQQYNRYVRNRAKTLDSITLF